MRDGLLFQQCKQLGLNLPQRCQMQGGPADERHQHFRCGRVKAQGGKLQDAAALAGTKKFPLGTCQIDRAPVFQHHAFGSSGGA